MKTQSAPYPARTPQPPAGPRTSMYRRYFTAEECAMLDATPVDDLSSEINLLRLLIARVLRAVSPQDAANRAREISLEMHAAVLSAFSAAGIVIASLFRLQCKLHDPNDGLWAEIEAGKDLARQHRGVYTYFSHPSPA